jgi:hypothetical protein
MPVAFLKDKYGFMMKRLVGDPPPPYIEIAEASHPKTRLQTSFTCRRFIRRGFVPCSTTAEGAVLYEEEGSHPISHEEAQKLFGSLEEIEENKDLKYAYMAAEHAKIQHQQMMAAEHAKIQQQVQQMMTAEHAKIQQYSQLQLQTQQGTYPLQYDNANDTLPDPPPKAEVKPPVDPPIIEAKKRYLDLKKK